MRLLLGNSIGTFTFRYDSYMRQRIGFGTILDEATRLVDTIRRIMLYFERDRIFALVAQGIERMVADH